MSLNSRLPPSLLAYSDLWDDLETRLASWLFDSLGLEGEIEIVTRKNISAKEAEEIIGTPSAYRVLETGEPVPAGILLCSAFMTRYAAFRLHETPEKLSGTSPVFLQLLGENVSKDLLFRLSSWLVMSTDVEPLYDALQVSLSTAPLNNTNRYVLIIANISTGDESFVVTFLVELECLLELHRERMRRRANPIRHGVANPTLRSSVRRSMLDLEVVMDKMDMTVAECSRLKVGQEIPLPSADGGALNLIAKTIRGDEQIAQGQLGTWKNFKAFKLSTPVSDGFLKNMVEL